MSEEAAKTERKSQRFESRGWMRYVVPAILVLIVLGILFTLIVIGLSVFGLTPGS